MRNHVDVPEQDLVRNILTVDTTRLFETITDSSNDQQVEQKSCGKKQPICGRNKPKMIEWVKF